MVHRPYALIAPEVELPSGPVHGTAVLVEHGSIAAVTSVADIPDRFRRIDLEHGLLAPGFVDIQVNGGGGVLFNDDPTPEGLAVMAAAHRRFGTTAMLPTLISDRRHVREAAVDAVRAALAQGTPGIAGLHLEGPHLLERRKGVHLAPVLGPPDPEDLALMRAPGIGRLLVTVAPELVPPETIRTLAASGTVVALGHSDATWQAAIAAFDAGATGVTHLFNAMSQLGSREPGLVGAALARDTVWCGIIADGHHVHWDSFRIAARLKRERLVLVTDAMPCVGSEASDFPLQGRTIRVVDGRCTTEDGTLAGSALDMASAVRNAVTLGGLSRSAALYAATAAPAAAVGLDDRFGRIAPGMRADLVLLDADLQVVETWIGGIPSGGI